MSQVAVDIGHAVLGDNLVLDVGQCRICVPQTVERFHGDGFQVRDRDAARDHPGKGSVRIIDGQ